jgi:hypothetical protein
LTPDLLFFLVYWIKRKIYHLMIYCFTSRSRIFHLYGDVTNAAEGLQNLGLCFALWAFEQGGIVVVPQLLWHGTLVFSVASEGPPHLVASYGNMGMWGIYSNPDAHGSRLKRLIDYVVFDVPLKSFSRIIMEMSPLRWNAAKFRSMLSAHGFWAGPGGSSSCHNYWDTRDLGFSGLIRRATPFSRLLRHAWGCGGSILTRILTGITRKKTL